MGNIEERLGNLERKVGIVKDEIPEFEYTQEDMELIELGFILHHLDSIPGGLGGGLPDGKGLKDFWGSLDERIYEAQIKPIRHMDSYYPDGKWRLKDKKDLQPGMDFKTLLTQMIGKVERDRAYIYKNILFTETSFKIWEKYVPDELKPLLRNKAKEID